ncbi:sodium-dependent multivitamin transporter-like [Diadema setosum]|uniref:sodium-dependent multivitamin transporter-like n=1 Tax=Diadema setosum TaxID=31175 RepID=UPI003B3B7203
MDINETTTMASTNATMNGNNQPFSAIDYVVFSAMLAASLATGLYHAFAGGGQTTTRRFLLADRSMSSLPIALSTVVSFLSAITLLGHPAEIYQNGIQYWLVSFSFIIRVSVPIFVFVPVYYGLGLVSAYQYLHLRFGLLVRIFGTAMFILHTSFYLAIVLYAPALAIQAVTSLPMPATIFISGAVCTIYTALGGIKGVIWADVFQFFVLVVSFLTVVILGSIRAGGVEHVWEFNREEGHLNFFVFSPDPTVRLTFWGAIIGAGFQGLTQSVNQIAVQRFLTAKSLKAARRSLLYGLPGEFFMTALVSFSGLVMYAYYNYPGSGRSVPDDRKRDQILITFVNQEFGRIPGIQGLFIAALYAGTISTVTSGLNSLAAVTLVDIVKPWRKWRHRDDQAAPDSGEIVDRQQDSCDTTLSKFLTLGFGLITLSLAFVSTKMGSLVRMGNTIIGALGGPLVGLFSLGMLYKRANVSGALFGLLFGAVMGITLSIGSMINKDVEEDEKSWFFRISFMWYSLISTMSTFIFGIIVSELSRAITRRINPDKCEEEVDPSLLATFIRPKKYQTVSSVAGENYELKLQNDVNKASDKMENDSLVRDGHCNENI